MLKRLLSRVRASAPATRPAPLSHRLGVESLEAREVPAIVYGVTQQNNLIRFDSDAPGAILSSAVITGMQPGDQVITMDFRPRTGQLIATALAVNSPLGSPLRTYAIQPLTGAATFLGDSADGLTQAGATNLVSTSDFNPTNDLLRFIQTSGVNDRINPDIGTVAGMDQMLTYTMPAQGPIIAVAYDRNFDRVNNTLIKTTLYGIDGRNNSLDIIGGLNGAGVGPNGVVGPNGGGVTSVGSLNLGAGQLIDIDSPAGFDITPGPANNGKGNALAALTIAGVTRLYSINLTTGAGTSLGSIDNGSTRLAAIAIVPASTTVLATGPGVVGRVFVSDSTSLDLKRVITPFGNSTAGLKTAVGDVNGDGTPDVVVMTNNRQGFIKVYDGVTGGQIVGPLASFTAFPGIGGRAAAASVAVGDVNGDGFDDVIVAAGVNGMVRVYSGQNGSQLLNVTGFPRAVGVTSVAAADFNRDGRAEIVIGSPRGGAVKVYTSTGALFRSDALPGFAFSFNVFPNSAALTGVAAGDVNGDGRADLIVSSGGGSRGTVRVFDGFRGTTIAAFNPVGNYSQGLALALADFNQDGLLDIQVTPGPRIAGYVASYSGSGQFLGFNGRYSSYTRGFTLSGGRAT